jgi:virulence-associated protein VagC
MKAQHQPISMEVTPLEIERVGDEIRIRPARKSLSGVLDKFAQFSTDFMAAGRGDQVQAERVCGQIPPASTIDKIK